MLSSPSSAQLLPFLRKTGREAASASPALFFSCSKNSSFLSSASLRTQNAHAPPRPPSVAENSTEKGIFCPPCALLQLQGRGWQLAQANRYVYTLRRAECAQGCIVLPRGPQNQADSEELPIQMVASLCFNRRCQNEFSPGSLN